MRFRSLAVLPLATLAASAFAVNFQPGYWKIVLSDSTGQAVRSGASCLEEMDTHFKFDELQSRYCKRLEYSVTTNAITTRVHCIYPNIERTSYEQIIFNGDTMKGIVRIDQTKPQKQNFAFTLTGTRLAQACPQAPAAASR
ncbi:MAG: DUF3617 family protein [Bryobacteraceae bacterium]